MEKGNAMRIKVIMSLLIITVLGASTVFCAEDDRPHIGIMLDPEPLPELLIKHLRLEEGEGTRIVNVVIGGAGDKANLQRDDIIIGFEGRKIDGAEMLIDQLRKYEVGQETTLEIIHLGQRKDVKLKLGASVDQIKWKYPVEPNAEMQWKPGNVYRVRPGQGGLTVMPFDRLMPNPQTMTDGGRMDVMKFFGERYSYGYSDGGRELQVNIEGNPEDGDTVVTVRIGNEEHRASVNDINMLPEEYRKSALDALEKAKKGRGFGGVGIHIGEGGTGLSDYPTISDFPWPPSGQNDERLDQLEKRLQQLQDRLERLEKQRHSRGGEPREDQLGQEQIEQEKLEQKQRGPSNSIGVGVMIEGLGKT